MIEKLYYTQPYLTTWETRITQTVQKEKDIFVLLEETAFYPHGGGQPCDLGHISGIPVLDVTQEGNQVWHQVERLPETVDVACQLDWTRRFDHMQQHTGQHLLSAVFLEHLQARTVSFHLGTDYVSIDVDLLGLSSEQLALVEGIVNNEIYRNRLVKSYFVSHEELEKLPLVKQPNVTENIRIVEIEGVEYNACGGTHVARTGEIGIIKILKTEKQKEGTRIYFKCGTRAVEEFKNQLHILGSLASAFQTGRENILDRFNKWVDERKQLEAHLAELKENNRAFLAKELLTQAAEGSLTHVFADMSLKDMQELGTQLATQHSLLVLLASTSEHKVVLIHDGTFALSCGKLMKEHLSAFNGKGGGSDKAAQAGFTSADDALRFFNFVCKQIKQ